MKIKTQDLTDRALDWAVETALGGDHTYRPRNYSTEWAQGGPIIERERISVGTEENGWSANITAAPTGIALGFGPTPLVAAMRCYVASKLGDTVDVPEELL